MASIEQAPPVDPHHDEKKGQLGADLPYQESGGESPTCLEEGEKGGLLLNEEEIIARVKAFPDDSTPLYLTWAQHDATNPRNWPKWKKWYITCFASFLNFLT